MGKSKGEVNMGTNVLEDRILKKIYHNNLFYAESLGMIVVST